MDMQALLRGSGANQARTMIHYHGTPMSGPAETRLALIGRHACVSFANPGDIDVVAEVCQSFILDNGAFTAWKQGATYDVDAFAGWARHWMGHPGCDWALAPDVIDGGENANDTLLARFPGFVPVWHLDESIDRLWRLCNEHPRIALGSAGAFATVGDERWWARMAEAMERICPDGSPICKLHGLRMLDATIFSRLPLSSADSTNVARNIGMDGRWKGTYTPKSQRMRAAVMMERIEHHASAATWNPGSGTGRNWDLIG